MKGRAKAALAAAAGGVMLVAGGVYRGDIVVKADPGGDVAKLYSRYYSEWSSGLRHVIDGRCASACTMRLAFDNTCVTPNARLGFHKAYYAKAGPLVIESKWGTQYMMERWPPRIRERIEPVLSHDMTWLSSAEAQKLGVPAC
jgi:hypothetical protein